MARSDFIGEMVPIAGRIPDEVLRERFADRLAQRTGIALEVVRAEIRKARGQTSGSAFTIRDIPSIGQVTKAEKGLIWFLVHDPARALTALRGLDVADFDALSARSVLDLARKLDEDRGFSPSVLLERLSMGEAQLVTAIASESEPPVHEAEDCARALRRARCERETRRCAARDRSVAAVGCRRSRRRDQRAVGTEAAIAASDRGFIVGRVCPGNCRPVPPCGPVSDRSPRSAGALIAVAEVRPCPSKNVTTKYAR